MKKKLYLAKENSPLPEYQILHGIHPFNAEQIMSFKLSYATRPINDAGYYTLAVDDVTRYVFESRERTIAEEYLLNLARDRFGFCAKRNGLEAIDLTVSQSQPKCTEQANPSQILGGLSISAQKDEKQRIANRHSRIHRSLGQPRK